MKKSLLITLVFMFAFATNALAHTGLEISSPENGEIITEELREITLTFEGKVEQGSTFELSNANGQSIPVEEISIEETLMTGNLKNALENGDYTVVWNIIGADGHPIAGEFSFSVDVPVVEEQTESEAETEDDAISQDASQEETQLENVEDTKADEQSQSTSYLMPVIVILLIVIIVGIFIGLRRKK